MAGFSRCKESGLRAQGATEYLVLLAVVLVIALVAIALLGFFPGMAGDAQETQSKMYWQSATPIAITEWGARTVNTESEHTVVYMRIRNTGNYQITINKVLAGNGSITGVWTGGWGPILNLNSTFVIQPGEEKEFGSPYFGRDPGSGNRRFFTFYATGPYQSSHWASVFNGYTAQSLCLNETLGGYLVVKNFGFEYIETIERLEIKKRQIGTAPVVIKCNNRYN